MVRTCIAGYHLAPFAHNMIKTLFGFYPKTSIGRIVYFYPRIQAVYDKPFSEAFVIN